MKKSILFSILIVSFFIFNIDVHASTTYTRGIIHKNSKMLSSPGGSALKSDTGGTITLKLPEAVEVLGEEGDYYKIKFMYSGFIYNGYLPKSNIYTYTYTTDDTYEQNLINIGFPAEYASKLAILHAIHPNWNFTPSFTGGEQGGMDFYTAVKGEASVLNRNVINSANTTLRSTADGAYKNGEWISLAGNGWYAASEQTIAFFLDPRNFLDESEIFMFENLAYNPSIQSKDVVEKVLAGTFMSSSNPFECYEGANSCSIGPHYYADTFMNAGMDKKVSPVHLATRVRIEQGTNGSVLSLGKGYNGDLIGYYNFFNISASGKTDSEVIINGLTYAKNKNWNNQHISIYDGSNTIANYYIGRGQSTLYYQKFNTLVKPLYGPQYQQNVKAPFSEGYTTYSSYYKAYSTIEEWDNAAYDFLIPIYSNMGSPTTLDVSQNGDATLKNLNISSCKLNPDFQSSAYNYDCYIDETVKELNVSAEPTNSRATVKYEEKTIIDSDEKTIKILVTAVNGTSQEYIINIHREKREKITPVEILNNVGIKVNDEYISNIAIGSDISNIINSVLNKYHFATIKITEANGQEIKEGIAKTGQIITLSSDGETITRKIVIYGDTTGDGIIDIRDLLSIQKHLLKSKILEHEYFEASDVNKSKNVDIVDLLQEQKHIMGASIISQS